MLLTLAAIIAIIWYLRKDEKKKEPEGTFLTEEQIAQRAYNAKQWVERNLQAEQNVATVTPKRYTKREFPRLAGKQTPAVLGTPAETPPTREKRKKRVAVIEGGENVHQTT